MLESHDQRTAYLLSKIEMLCNSPTVSFKVIRVDFSIYEQSDFVLLGNMH